MGTHCVLEALRAKRRALHRLRIRAGARGEAIRAVVAAAEAAGVAVVEEATLHLGAAGPEGNPQGVALEAGPLPELDLETLLSVAGEIGEGGGRRLVALDGVEDPQNVGSLARVAEAAGACGLVLTKRRAPPLTPTLARASAGAIEWLPVARVANLPRAIKSLKAQGFWSVGADPGAPRSLFDVEPRILRGNLVVVLGAEGRGIRPGVAREIDHPVQIPMRGRVASLNVATAGAVLLFELMRRSDLKPSV